MSDATQILFQIEQGDPSASEQLLPLVYRELRQLAEAKLAHERPGQTLQATALVHEAYLRLVDVEKVQHWDSRGHFFAAAAEAMRRVLVDRARRKQTRKHGGDFCRAEVDVAELAGSASASADLLALDEALAQLEQIDQRAASVVKLRFFAGLTGKQTAEALGVSNATVDSDWAYARSWLRGKLAVDHSGKADAES